MPIYAYKTLQKRNPPAGKKPVQKTIWVPAWNDVIHLTDERQLPADEQRRRHVRRIRRLKESPTPEIVKNIGTILMALDDIQDFTTTAGVTTRIIGRIWKPAMIAAKGSFTSGALLNAMAVHNKLPLQKLSPSAIKAMITRNRLGFDKLSTHQKRTLERMVRKADKELDKALREKQTKIGKKADLEFRARQKELRYELTKLMKDEYKTKTDFDLISKEDRIELKKTTQREHPEWADLTTKQQTKLMRDKYNTDRGYSLLNRSQLQELADVAEKAHPKWEKLSVNDKQAFMKKNYKMSRERWGMPLKVKKRMAEDLYSKGTPWGKIKTDVDKRLKRLLPTHGEALEIAQTSDQLAGVGISFGPLVGFVQDLMFGVRTGAKWKFTSNRPSSAEKKVLMDALNELIRTAKNPLRLIDRASQVVYHGTIAWASLPEDAYMDFLHTVWGVAQATAVTRGPEVWKAIKNVGKKIWRYQWDPGPKTPKIIREALTLEGIDPDQKEAWPGIDLPRIASLEAISTAYLPRIQAQTRMFQEKLDGTVEGEFLAACLDTIAFNTAMAVSEEGAPIKETFAPELSIYTRAIDYGLEPPLWASEEEFKAWHSYCMEYVRYFDQEGPPYDLLQRAYQNFFPGGSTGE